jgi:uncharacterized protein YdcH (DUF465 family)
LIHDIVMVRQGISTLLGGRSMEQALTELKAHLMATSEEFRQLAAQHAEYERQLDAIEAKPHVTPEDEVEEHRIKKLKLHVKDQMNDILAHSKAEKVA